MKITKPRLAELHAARAAKRGGAPTLSECLDAAREGRLFDVDTQGAGEDCLAIADDAEIALAEVALCTDPDASTAHPDGAAAWAFSKRWTANRIELETSRLSELDPREVGRIVARRVVEYVSRLSMRLSPGVTVDVYAPRFRENALPAHGAVTDEALDSTDLALSVSAIVEYAQKGRAWDWQGHEDAADAAAELVSTLAPDLLGAGGTEVADVLLGHAEGSDDALRLVPTAAWARVMIGRGEAVTATHLGALAGFHPSRIRALRSAGEIPGWTADGSGKGSAQCPAAVARQWLAARGIDGL